MWNRVAVTKMWQLFGTARARELAADASNGRKLVKSSGKVSRLYMLIFVDIN